LLGAILAPSQVNVHVEIELASFKKIPYAELRQCTDVSHCATVEDMIACNGFPKLSGCMRRSADLPLKTPSLSIGIPWKRGVNHFPTQSNNR
jgi:hypothetical protein